MPPGVQSSDRADVLSRALGNAIVWEMSRLGSQLLVGVGPGEKEGLYRKTGGCRLTDTLDDSG